MNFLFKNELIIVINDKKDKLDLKLDARHFTTVATIQMNVQKTKNCSEGMQNRNSDTFKVLLSVWYLLYILTSKRMLCKGQRD